MAVDLMALLKLVSDLSPIVQEFQALPADKRDDIDVLLPLVAKAARVLNENGITFEGLADVIEQGGPLLARITALFRR